MRLSLSKARKHYGVSSSTLRRWADNGRIQSTRTAGGHRMFIVCNEQETEKERIIYCRVSSVKQKDDLVRQIKFLSDKFPQHKIVRDVGSGINFKRPGLLSLLGRVMQGRVREVVVSSKDRLCRFAFDLLQWICFRNGTQVVVLDNEDKSPDQEFTEDILAIMQVFSCRWNGKRRYSAKVPCSEDPMLPERVPKEGACADGRMHQVYVQQGGGDD